MLLYVFTTRKKTMCSIQLKPISEMQKLYNGKAAKAQIKEQYGFPLYNFDFDVSNDLKYIMQYQCEDGNAELKIGFDTYTNEDIKTLKDEKHCLRYRYYGKYSIPKEDCFNAFLLKDSIDAGLTCGYFEYNIKYEDGSTESFKTCDIFNKESLNLGIIDENIKKGYEEYTVKMSGKKLLLSFEIKFVNKN